jgi:ComF family protein
MIYDNQIDLKKIIFLLKNKNDEYIFDRVSKLMILFFSEYISNFDLICSVPSHFLKFSIKGFNTSEIIAYKIIKNINKNYSNINFSDTIRLLKKIKNNSRQRGKNFLERKINNDNVFEINSKFFSNKIILGKKILIIDDVFTTGSTINECAKILKKNGAKFIGALTIAKTDIEHDM